MPHPSAAGDASQDVGGQVHAPRWHVGGVSAPCPAAARGLTPAEATAAVRKELLGAAAVGQVVVGVDSPPAIAAEFMACSWTSWAQKFSTTYDTPEAFREATSVAGEAGARREPKRQTDVVHKTPLPPQNLRMYKQTWWAIHGIFAPLSLGGIVDAFSNTVGMLGKFID